MQAMSLSQLCSRFRMIWLCFLLCLLAKLGDAFELETPPRLIITHEPTSIGYKIKADGSEETRWIMNITDLDGRNPETLNDGEIFEASSAQGNVEVIIEREGLFLLKAVNPDRTSQAYATSLPAIVVDTPPSGGSGSGNASNSGSGSEDGDGSGSGGSEGDGSSGDDGDGNEDGNEDGSDDGDSTGDDGDSTGDETGDSDGEGSNGSTSTSPESGGTLSSARPTRTPAGPGSPLGATGKNGNGNTGLIAGCITAGVIALILMLAALFFFRRRQSGKKPSRPLTFYRDRMIRAPTPPQDPVQIQPPPASILRSNSGIGYPGPGSSGLAGLGAGAGAYGMHQAPMAYPYKTPHSASATGVNAGGASSPGIREFILRSPRPLPPSPSGGPGGLKEFILKSPMRDSFAGYSKP